MVKKPFAFPPFELGCIRAMRNKSGQIHWMPPNSTCHLLSISFLILNPLPSIDELGRTPRKVFSRKKIIMFSVRGRWRKSSSMSVLVSKTGNWKGVKTHSTVGTKVTAWDSGLTAFTWFLDIYPLWGDHLLLTPWLPLTPDFITIKEINIFAPRVISKSFLLWPLQTRPDPFTVTTDTFNTSIHQNPFQNS